MKTLSMILAMFVIAPLAFAENPALIDMRGGPDRPAPVELSFDSYAEWVKPLLQDSGSFSAFTGRVFDWYEQEKGRDLPGEVSRDPGRIFVNVDRPLQQTIELEEAGEIEEGNTVGAEAYVEMDGTTDQALAALLMLWGKPLDAEEGFTYPAPSPFGRRIEYSAPMPEWGPGAYANVTLRRDGGIVNDLADRYLVLVRGNSQEGFTVVMQYVKPASPYETQTQQVFAIGIIRPGSTGKVTYRISTRYQGQSYKVLGNVSIGRAQIGFNRAKVREAMEAYRDRVKELKETGTIRQRKSNIEWGK